MIYHTKKQHNTMKYNFFAYILLFIFLLYGSNSFAQSVSSDYFMKTSQTRHSLNPAFQPTQGYLGFPLLSSIYVGANTNTINLEHLTSFNDGELVSFLHPSVDAESFLSEMKANNHVTANLAYKLFSLGFFKDNGFWNIDVGIRANANINLPKDVFRFAKNGLSTNEADYPFDYDLKDVNGSVTAFGEIGLGHSRSFLDNSLQVGAKAKILLGIANFDVNIDRLDLHANIDNGISNWLINGKGSIQGSLKGLTAEYKTELRENKETGEIEEVEVFDKFEVDGGGIAGWGLGFDVGAVYTPTKLAENIENETLSDILNRTKVSMAFTDIGFISWSKKNTVKLVTSDFSSEIPGKDYDDTDSFEDRIDDIVSDFENILDLTEENQQSKGRSTSLATNMNIGLEYEAWKDNLTVGLLSSTQFGRYRTDTEFTLSANYYNPQRDWLAATFSYSFVHSKFNTFGLAVHLVPKKGLNLFLASDYVIFHVNNQFIPTTSKSVNFQIGISIPLGTRRS